MEKLSIKLILTGIISLLIALSACADNISENKTELKAIEKEISALLKKIQRDEKTLKKERTTLQETEQGIIKINKESERTQLEIDEARTLAKSLKAKADSERARISTQLSKLSSLVVSQHSMGEQGFLKLLLGQQDPAAIERTMVYYKYLAQLTSAQVADARVQVAQLAQLEASHTQQQNVLNELLEQQRNQQSALQNIRSKRKQDIANLDNQLTKSANRVGRLKEDQQRISNLVKGLQLAAIKRQQAREKAQAKAREKAQQKQSNTQSNQTASVNTTTTTRPVVQRVSNDGLGKLKGQLKMPVSGRINATYGSAKAGSGVKWNGIMLGTKQGEPVRSIYDGQVVYSDWFKGFGQLVIVDHGKGYMSLYSHNSQLTRSLGEQIKSNDIVAYAGSTGGLSDPGLYFEVRYNGEPRDPLLWVKR